MLEFDNLQMMFAYHYDWMIHIHTTFQEIIMMNNVFVVVYQEYSMDRFEVFEVFKTRVTAELYILNFPHDGNYYVENFIILEKKLWE